MALSAGDRATLVSLARSAAEAVVTGGPPPHVEDPAGVLSERRGCFVTLTNARHLRGCIGTFSPRGPLAETILAMGAAAARDPRFHLDPITPSELEQLTVEVSILSVLQEAPEPQKLEVGKDGIYIVRGGRSGCFLPEVATDQGWDAEEFLAQCCLGKAGLPADAWRDRETKVCLFTSEKFDH